MRESKHKHENIPAFLPRFVQPSYPICLGFPDQRSGNVKPACEVRLRFTQYASTVVKAVLRYVRIFKCILLSSTFSLLSLSYWVLIVWMQSIIAWPLVKAFHYVHLGYFPVQRRGLLTKPQFKMAGCWPSSFSRVYGLRRSRRRVHKLANRIEAIFSHIDGTSLINFIELRYHKFSNARS